MIRKSLKPLLFLLAATCFCTQEADAFYHADLGRWVNRDPIEYKGGAWNLYEYAGCNPVVEVDASGLSRYQKATCKKGEPYVDEKSGCEVCDYTCECPRGWNAGHISMTYNGWPCDQAPEIYCVKNRSWVDDAIHSCRIIGALGLVCGTVFEDVGTGGVGIVDDPACFAAAGVMICAPSTDNPAIGPGPNPLDPKNCRPCEIEDGGGRWDWHGPVPLF